MTPEIRDRAFNRFLTKGSQAPVLEEAFSRVSSGVST